MKKATFLFVALLLSSALRAEELPVVLNGQYRDPVNVYRIGASYFLSAKEAARLYGGQHYWYPVSGRVQLSVHGKSLQLQAGSAQVQVGDTMRTLDAPVMLRTSQAYIPLSFFETEAFSAWAGMDAVFNPRTKLLTLDRRATIGEVRWFSYKDYTRLVVELSPRAQFSVNARGVGGVEISFPLGTIGASEQADINDDVVDFYSLTQGAKAGKLMVKFGKRGLNWTTKTFENPRRMILDVFKPGIVPTSAQEPAPEPKSAKSLSQVSSESVKLATTQKSIGPIVEGRSDHAKRRIVVDAGHGGKDPGATGSRGTEEKDINLAAALELSKLLKQEGAFEVLLTRADNTFVPLADRSRMANEFGADLFISLHCNASRHPKDNGFEVYFLSEKATDPEAQRLADFENSSLELEGKTAEDAQAELLLMEMSKTENINSAAELSALVARALAKRVDIADNGVKQAGFYVLRGTHAPAILFEMAYISNKRDEAKLESKKYRRKLTDGIYAGILDYAKRQGWLSGAGR